MLPVDLRGIWKRGFHLPAIVMGQNGAGFAFQLWPLSGASPRELGG